MDDRRRSADRTRFGAESWGRRGSPAVERAREMVARETGGHVLDSAFIQEVMLAHLTGGAGERDAGKAAHQIALTVDLHGRARRGRAASR